jgi:hypothetical protein
MKTLTRASLAMVVLAALTGPAAAQDDVPITKDNWPLAYNDRPLTLAKGMLEIGGDTVRINLSKDAVGKPISFMPSIYYGVNEKLTVGAYHPVNGICISGEENGCAKVYNDLAVHALYGLMTKGTFLLTAHAGLAFLSLSDPTAVGVQVGGLGQLTISKLAILFYPLLTVGVTERDAGNKEFLSIPVWFRYQVNPQLNPFLSTGIAGPLDGFGDAYAIPVGLGVLYAINNRLDVGTEFVFTNLAGKGGGADGRALFARVVLRI